jgi:hypothetical protein
LSGGLVNTSDSIADALFNELHLHDQLRRARDALECVPDFSRSIDFVLDDEPTCLAPCHHSDGRSAIELQGRFLAIRAKGSYAIPLVGNRHAGRSLCDRQECRRIADLLGQLLPPPGVVLAFRQRRAERTA